MLGKTDKEIMSQYLYRANDINTFRVTIPIADQYTMAAGVSTQFIELGEIRQRPRLLQFVRTPVFTKEGRVDGTIGFAMDVSDHCDEVLHHVQRLVERGNATRIHPSIFILLKRDADCE